jgi:ATP-dependent DNA helicase RecG
MKTLQEYSVQFIKGVGPAKKKLLSNLGIDSLEDLFYFFPRRYEDRRKMTTINQIKLGEWQTIAGKVLSFTGRRSWYTKKHVTEVMINDGTGNLYCVWFNQPFLERYFKTAGKIVLYGKVDIYKGRLQMISPEYEFVEEGEDENLSLGRIVPVYSLTRGITQRFLRKIIRYSLDQFKDSLEDELPIPLRNKHKLYNLKRSIENIHFPQTSEDQESALKRISFEEFFFFQVSIILRRLSKIQKRGIQHRLTDAQALKFVHGFPFQLTSAQTRVIAQLRDDMSQSKPMLRLLQGDVGSGKTIVALFGCYNAFVNGHQSAFMSPTEILARQHYENILHLIESGLLRGLRLELLVSSLKEKEKELILHKIKNGEVDLVVGTHALINEEVVFKNLSFVVIDEQHKFGVRQRSLLSEKGTNPDILIMTATPIPRTLCITLYGDLDLSILDELPKNRGVIATKLFHEEDSKEVYELVRREIQNGSQAYIVYPIIEESEKSDLKAAQVMYKQFAQEEFKDYKIALIHGQMDRKKAKGIMQDFKEKKIDLLVSTTILEVGVDIPNATVMVIEHADRFGLAQLHQLRGRIGRGMKESYCFLIADPQNEEGLKRLEVISSTQDGFKIAEADLLIRGPGRFFGRHQHGLNELKVANPVTQLDILELARKEAKAIAQEDPQLNKPDYQNIKKIIKRRYPTYLSMVGAG